MTKTLHIFNPEHDIALASHLACFTAPQAGRQLRHDLGFLPALWAVEGDRVLVDDEAYAHREWQALCAQLARIVRKRGFSGGNRWFLPWKPMVSAVETNRVSPWGWDCALCAQLKRAGVPADALPTDVQLEHIRQLSHRRTAARLLPLLQTEGTVGEAVECVSADDVAAFLGQHGHIVVKAPWSSSGRGVRFVQTQDELTALNGWLTGVLKKQGSVMAEPYYHKVKDFAMEFVATETGQIRYQGLSLFHTAGSAYVGNLVASEDEKRALISRYIPVGLLDAVQEKIASRLDLGDYRGCFGVDMMVCAPAEVPAAAVDGPYLLHPCVEINLRRTMGHVALALGRHLLTDEHQPLRSVMQVEYDGNHYHLNIQQI